MPTILASFYIWIYFNVNQCIPTATNTSQPNVFNEAHAPGHLVWFLQKYIFTTQPSDISEIMNHKITYALSKMFPYPRNPNYYCGMFQLDTLNINAIHLINSRFSFYRTSFSLINPKRQKIFIWSMDSYIKNHAFYS